MLDGNRYFAEFPEEHPNRTRLTPALLSALTALEREISRVMEAAPDAAKGGVRCDNEER